MTLKAYCTVEFEGAGVASHHVIHENYLESRHSTIVWGLYWWVKLKTITERSCFVLLNWFSSCSVFKISSHPNFIRKLVQCSLTLLRDLEGQKQKFTVIHSVFVFPNPRSSRKLRTFYRMAEGNRIRINILSKQTLTGKRLTIRSRAVPWGRGRVGDKSGHIWGVMWCLPPGNLLGLENGYI